MIVLPKIIRGCDHCQNYDVELELVWAKLRNFFANRLLTTYRCPVCKEPHYDNEKITKVKQLV